MNNNSTSLQNHQLPSHQLAAQGFRVWGVWARGHRRDKKNLPQESHNMISECKIFAKGFLLRPDSSISNIYSKCLKFLEGTGFLTNNSNLQEHTSLKHTYFYFFSNCKRYWPSGKCRLPKHTAAFINSLFHWEVHLGLLEKANNNQACCYSILSKFFSQIPTKITFLHAPLNSILWSKICEREEVHQPKVVNRNRVTSSTHSPCLGDDIN